MRLIRSSILVVLVSFPALAHAQSGEKATTAAPAAPAAPAATATTTTPPEQSEQDTLLADMRAALNEQVVTGASRAAESASEAPATTSTIRAEDLRRYGIRTLAEALSFLSIGTFSVSGYTQEFQTLGARGVAIAGDSSNHFLIVVDGSVINDPRMGTARPGWTLGIPLEMIDTIEVILGAGSVLYGGNAMLGVISVRTKPARLMKGVRFITEMGISPAQNAKNEPRSWDPAGLGTTPRLGASVGHEFRAFGVDSEISTQLEWARNTLPDTFINAQNQALRPGTTAPQWGGERAHGLVLEEAFTNYTRARFGPLSIDFQITSHRTPLTGQGAFAPDFNRVEGLLARFDATYSATFTERLSGIARLYTGRDSADQINVTEAFTSSCSSLTGSTSSRCLATLRTAGQWQGIELQATYDFLGNGRLPLMVGVDGRLRQVGLASERESLATGGYLGTIGGMQSSGGTLSAYIQQRARISDWMTAHVGVRYDWVTDSAKGFPTPPTSNPVVLSDLPSVTNDAVSPRLALLFFPTKTTTLHAMAGTAFRAPTPQESFFSSGSFFALPKNLVPENVRTAEVGVRQKLGTHRAVVSGFYNQWNNLISFVPASATSFAFGNLGEINNYGVNAGVEGSLAEGKLQYGASLTYAYARRKATPNPAYLSPAVRSIVDANADTAESEVPLVASPAVSANARVSYDLGGELPTLALASSFYDRRLTSFAYSDTIYLGAASPRGPATATGGGYAWRSQLSPAYTDPLVELRAAVTGPLPSLPAFRYRLVANYLFAPWEPISLGPTPGGQYPALADIPGHPGFGGERPPQATGQLFPSTRLTLFAGLEVTLDP